MKKNPLANLLIRSAVVLKPDRGYILAFDPEREDAEEEHTISFKWQAGNFTRGEANFRAHASCIIISPDFGIVRLGGAGSYSVATQKGVTADNIFRVSPDDPRKPRYGDISSVATIDGKAYAAGFRGSVFRLDKLKLWTPIDQKLPDSFDIEAIHGFSATDIYTVGFKGEMWHFDGNTWQKKELPTNVILTCVLCAHDGFVYIGGHKGVLVRGRKDKWELVAHEQTTDDIWGLADFKENIYFSTMSGVYKIDGDAAIPIDFGTAKPNTTYQLSAVEDVMWSVGRGDIVSFDGNKWTTVVKI